LVHLCTINMMGLKRHLQIKALQIVYKKGVLTIIFSFYLEF